MPDKLDPWEWAQLIYWTVERPDPREAKRLLDEYAAAKAAGNVKEPGDQETDHDT